MPKETQHHLIETATTLFRKKGYVATSVEDICTAAGVSKGAFFHHFKSKEELAVAALANWDAAGARMAAAAPFNAIEDPVEKLLAAFDFYMAFFSNPEIPKACLAGMTAQETSETNPALREAANTCFVHGQQRFQSLFDAAVKKTGKPIDTASVGALFMSTLQGSILLARASQNQAVIAANLKHLKAYIATLLNSS